MPLAQLIDVDLLAHDDAALCVFLDRWGISDELGTRIVLMAGRLEFGIRIISGIRSEKRQDELRSEGRPTAPPGVSTHTSCPATGADLVPMVAAVTAVKARFGAEAVFAGLRWGGGSPIGDLESDEPGIPSDWHHVDLGPRM